MSSDAPAGGAGAPIQTTMAVPAGEDGGGGREGDGKGSRRGRVEAPPSAARRAQVANMIAKGRAKFVTRDPCASKCGECGYRQPCCFCAALRPLPNKHTVTVLLHPQEVGRVTSTHRLLARGLQRCHIRVWNSDRTPTVASAWEEMVAQCEVTGQVPAFLFPSRNAVPVGALLASLPPAKRAAGLHVCVIDGTWHNARTMAKYLPPDATCVVISPPAVITLFSPLRAQPAPGKVSTLEAVACVFDECTTAAAAASAAARRVADGDWGAEAGPSTPAPAPTTKQYLLSSAVSAPSYKSSHRSVDPVASGLRLYLQQHVDALCKQVGKLGARFQGVGYRTWYPGPAAGMFTRLPAHLIATIARFAYGKGAVYQDGYALHLEEGADGWRDVNLDPEARPYDDDSLIASIRSLITAAEEDASAFAAAVSNGEITFGAGGSGAAAIAVRGSTEGERGSDVTAGGGGKAGRSHRLRMLDAGPTTCNALALTCVDMLALAAGYMSGTWIPLHLRAGDAADRGGCTVGVGEEVMGDPDLTDEVDPAKGGED